MAEKVTIMVLKVDLQCSKCYKKVKKVLCKFPQIRGQVYDEKANAVTIKVVCCSPEKIRDKLCYKGGGSIKSIEIKSPEKPKKEEEKKKGEPKPPQKEPDIIIVKTTNGDDDEDPVKKGRFVQEKRTEPDMVTFFHPRPPPQPSWAGIQTAASYPTYYGGQPPQSYDGYYGRPVYDSWSSGGGGGGNCRGGYLSNEHYFSEENPGACTIM